MSGRKRPRIRPYHRHGLTTLRRTVEALGGRLLDGRTTLAKQLAAWRADLVQDLGADVSTQQAAVIDLAVRTKMLLDSIDAWLLVQPSLVNARKRALIPVVKERQTLADALARYLGQLGLDRRAKPVPDLSAYLVAREEVDAVDPARADPGVRREVRVREVDAAVHDRHDEAAAVHHARAEDRAAELHPCGASMSASMIPVGVCPTLSRSHLRGNSGSSGVGWWPFATATGLWCA
jgi:hypothetical protein